METDILRAELERLFELDELFRLSRDLLGFEPEAIGGTAARASFAGALTEHCVATDAVEALCDAILASKADVSPTIAQVRITGLHLDDDVELGDALGPYVLTRRLGDGRVGISYLASHGPTRVRLKILRHEPTRDQRGLQRFLTVTRLVGSIQHQGLPRFLEAGKVAGRYLVAHEFVDGQSLAQRLARTGPLHMSDAAPLIRTMLATLKALHERRIAHGDLRAENVIVCTPAEGLPSTVLLDAGSDRLRARARVGNGRTELFSTVGSPRSVAPEQIRGLSGDTRSDLYSLGALLFEILTGKPPFPEGTALDSAFGHLSKQPPVPSSLAPRGWVPEAIDQLILALLQKSPDDRPPSIDKVLAAFDSGSLRPRAIVDDAEVTRRIAALLAEPANSDLAVQLEETVESVGNYVTVADVLVEAAGRLEQPINDCEALERAAAHEPDFAEHSAVTQVTEGPAPETSRTPTKPDQLLGEFQTLVGGATDHADGAPSTDFDDATETTGVVANMGKASGLTGDVNDEVSDDDWGVDFAPKAEPVSAPAAVAAAPKQPTSQELKAIRNGLLFRAARLYARDDGSIARAEQVYERLVAIDPADKSAANALEDVRRKQGRFDAIIESLLQRSDAATNPADRARALAEIGRVYATDLREIDQAAVAYTQALCEDPGNAQYARELERLAATAPAAWQDILTTCGNVCAQPETPSDSRLLLLNRTGHWYQTLLKRPDVALQCFQAVTAVDPANEAALSGLTDIYRGAHAFAELAAVLLQRADAAATPAAARDLRVESARVFAQYLNNLPRARELLEAVRQEDPTHTEAAKALGELYEQTHNYAGLVLLLESQLETASGGALCQALCRIAEIYCDRLGQPADAVKYYERALREDSQHLGALHGLDKIYSLLGRFSDVLYNLEQQIELAATPRQKIALWQRIASIHDEEFVDHRRAAEAWEAVLELDNANELALVELTRHCRALDRWEDVETLYGRQLKLATDPAKRFSLTLARAQVLEEQLGLQDRAIEAFESALALNPDHAIALEALSRLRQATGDADAALAVIESLAQKATTAEGKAEQHLKAAKLLERRGDRLGAIEAFKRALDVYPGDVAASTGLREAYLAGGDVSAALQLLEREVEVTQGDRAKAKILGQIAVLARDRLGDNARAEDASRRALKLDPTNFDALHVLGDVAFENGRFVEAATSYESLVERADSMPADAATQLLIRYVDALCRSGAAERSTHAVETLRNIAGDNADALRRAGDVLFEFGDAKRTAEHYRDFLARFDSRLSSQERAHALYRYGQSLCQSGQPEAALEPLKQAADLDEGNRVPLMGLAAAHALLGDWEEVIRVKNRHLDLAGEEERERLLVEIGEIAAEKLEDRTRAAKSFVAALEMRPDDRRLLTKLMQLYGDEKDWTKLVDVVLRLAEFVIEPEQKAKYLHTAAKVTARQLGDVEQALEYYERVLTISPHLIKALDEVAQLERDRGNTEAVERMLRRKLEHVQQGDDKALLVATFDELGELYKQQPGTAELAIDAFESAHALDPENRQRAQALSELYVANSSKYLEKAVKAQEFVLNDNPYRAESYKLLRRLYTETRNADASWCLCQTLSVLKLAEPDEERFYTRMRSETAAPAQSTLTEDDWNRNLTHPWAEPLVTAVFALIEPAVIAKRGETFEQAGYFREEYLDVANHYAPLSQNLYYAAGVLGTELPLCFENASLPGGLHFLHTQEPSIVLGAAALAPDVPPQAAAFIAARHLSYFRPGFYLRQLLPSGTGLKSWLFAAIKLVSPQFPVAPELEGSVHEAVQALDVGLQGQPRDHLTRTVTKLLQSSSALDLRRWVVGVDLTADRVGFVVAHDLRTAFGLIKATPEDGTLAVSGDQRTRELAVFSVSAQYLRLRQTLGIRVDS